MTRRATAAYGGMQIIADCVRSALQGAGAAERRSWELHVVGHSAGSIVAAHAMPLFCNTGVAFKTLQFMAPAMTVELFRETIMAPVGAGACPMPDLYILSDTGERDDDVGPYGKSLLYLVSNAFEGRRGTPLLGMERYVAKIDNRLDPAADPEVEALLRGHVTVAGAGGRDDAYPVSRSDTHGGFDNDPATMNSLLWRVLGRAPARAFTVRDLQY